MQLTFDVLVTHVWCAFVNRVADNDKNEKMRKRHLDHSMTLCTENLLATLDCPTFHGSASRKDHGVAVKLQKST